MSPQHQPLDEVSLEIAEDWLDDCYEEDGIEPEYFYMNKAVALILYGELAVKFKITDYKTGMIKLVSKEDKAIAH